MKPFPPTLIIRHKKENLKKCSLKGLRPSEDLRFFSYPGQPLPSFEDYVVLTVDSSATLSFDDRSKGLLFLDATWRYALIMKKQLCPDDSQTRRLPDGFQTAYPRRQSDCPDPAKGLASIEALYCAYWILGRNQGALLEHYHWKQAFLEKNQMLLSQQGNVLG